MKSEFNLKTNMSFLQIEKVKGEKYEYRIK